MDGFLSVYSFDKVSAMKFLSVLLAVVSFLLSGCLTSQEPFALADEKLSDDRLPGTYLNVEGKAFLDIGKQSEETGRYTVAVFGDNPRCNYGFTGTLFQIGTNRFLDLIPTPEACDHVAASPPGLIEILQAVTLLPLHMAIKVKTTTNTLEFAFASREGLQYAAERYPELFSRDELPRMRPNTKNQREFLLKMGGDTNVFILSSVKRRNDR
jgi:hypothetical protein